MQLRESEAFGVFDEHHRGVGHVYADFDHCGRNQHIVHPGAEELHLLVALDDAHLAVHQTDTQILQLFVAQAFSERRGRFKVRELLGLAELPAEDEHDFNTVAGMIVAHFGRIPQVGERFDWRGWRFEVVDLDGARVDKILAARVPVAADAEESG